MTARQGKLAVAAAVGVLSAMLFYKAITTGNWIGFGVTELGILLPMGISWRILSGSL